MIDITFPTPKTAKIAVNGKVVVKKCKIEDLDKHLKRLGAIAS
jgi:hypothetical protein